MDQSNNTDGIDVDGRFLYMHDSYISVGGELDGLGLIGGAGPCDVFWSATQWHGAGSLTLHPHWVSPHRARRACASSLTLAGSFAPRGRVAGACCLLCAVAGDDLVVLGSNHTLVERMHFGGGRGC